MNEDRVDPTLKKAILKAWPYGAIDAIITLSDKNPETIESRVREMLGRAEQGSKLDVIEFNVFKNLGMFAVNAPSALMNVLIGDDEVRFAGLNERAEAI